MAKIPPYPRLLSLITLLYGIFVFFWLSPEDSVWLVSVLGWGMSILLIVHGVFRFSGRIFPGRLWIAVGLALGGLSGVGAVACTVLLMLMKTSLHSHIYPDYPYPLMSGIVDRLPAWTLAGALLGLAVALWSGRRQSR